MKAFYTDHFVLPLPDGHRFPMNKYRLLRDRLLSNGILPETNLLVPPAATEEEILRAHTIEYYHAVCHGQLTPSQIRRLGFPWSAEMVERSRRSAGATIQACAYALREGIAVNLAGGTHHAYADDCSGFCVFNDSAVAARAMIANGLVRRVLVIDTDVHQGDGTAAIFSNDPNVFTFSLHGDKNFPLRKRTSDLDISLPDGTQDQPYLQSLKAGLEQSIMKSCAELAIYLSGADPFEGDRLGRLSITKQGLSNRDHLVFKHCLAARIPVAVTMGGGYATHIEDTVDIHLQTVSVAASYASQFRTLVDA